MINPAKFRAIRAVLHLSVACTAAILKVNERTVRRWEYGDSSIPCGAYQELVNLLTSEDRAAIKLLAKELS